MSSSCACPPGRESHQARADRAPVLLARARRAGFLRATARCCRCCARTCSRPTWMPSAAATPSLSSPPRQKELLRMVAAGHTNAQIARRLGISEGTVGTPPGEHLRPAECLRPHRRRHLRLPSLGRGVSPVGSRLREPVWMQTTGAVMLGGRTVQPSVCADGCPGTVVARIGASSSSLAVRALQRADCCDALACRRTAFESLSLRWMVPRVLIASSGSLVPEHSWCYECVSHDPAAYLAGFFGPRACPGLSGGSTARIGT